jgi:hypothetical protein
LLEWEAERAGSLTIFPAEPGRRICLREKSGRAKLRCRGVESVSSQAPVMLDCRTRPDWFWTHPGKLRA